MLTPYLATTLRWRQPHFFRTLLRFPSSQSFTVPSVARLSPSSTVLPIYNDSQPIHTSRFTLFHRVHHYHTYGFWSRLYMSSLFLVAGNDLQGVSTKMSGKRSRPARAGASSSTRRVERKTMEKDRRNKMKNLYSMLNSLVPNNNEDPKVINWILITSLSYLSLVFLYVYRLARFFQIGACVSQLKGIPKFMILKGWMNQRMNKSRYTYPNEA